jgi:hypothetical protein
VDYRTGYVGLVPGDIPWQLATMTNYTALVAFCKKRGWEPPDKPQLFLACDVEPTCQKVLLHHKDWTVMFVTFDTVTWSTLDTL